MWNDKQPSQTRNLKMLWGRLRLLVWLWFCCHVWLPWLFYKHRRRSRKAGS